MKNLFTVLFFFLSTVVYGQDAQKPHWMFGGIVGYSSGDNTPFIISSGNLISGSKSSNNSFTIQPYLGRLINRRWIAGIKTKYVYQLDKFDLLTEVSSSAKTHTGSLGIFARYKLTPGNKLVFQLEPCYFYNLSNTTLHQSAEQTQLIKTRSHSIALSPLATYKVAPRIVLAVRFSALTYEIGHWQLDGQNTKNDFSKFDGNLNINKLNMGVALLF